jgi:hypothetical protein
MKYKKHTVVVTISLLIIVMSLGQHQVSAAFVWSDNFNDGNYDGWTVVNGTWSASSNALIATSGTGPNTLSNIYYPSTVNYGNFSFDFFQDDTVSGTYGSFVFVHGDSIEETGILNAIPFNGIMLNINTGNLVLMRNWDNMGSTLDTYSHSEVFDGWYHIDMIVMSNHSIHVYLEKELVMTGLCLSNFAQSECFFALMPDNGGIDNVIVDAEDVTTSTPTSDTSTTASNTTMSTSDTTSSTIDTTTSSETTPSEGTSTPTTSPTQPEPVPLDMTTIAIIAGGGVLVVIVLFVVLKRR